MKDLQGVWINDIPDKSVTVSIDKIDAFTGQLTGTAKVVAGNFNREVPLTGWVTVSPTSGAKENGDRRIVFSFSACIGELGMVNSWSGIYAVIDGKPLLLTHWIQNRALSGYSWDHSIVGEERFHRPEEQ